MTKIGILGCGYECDEYIDAVLSAWIKIKKENNLNVEFVFSFVYCQFKEYIEINGEKEIIEPEWYSKYKEHIDFFFTPKPSSEAEARNIALKPLLDNHCDVVWILDLQDEIYTINNIRNIADFIQRDGGSTAWFSICLKNYVFDDKTYLLDPFTPPRVFRTYYNNTYVLKSFEWDNDPFYERVDRQVNDLLKYEFDTTGKISYKQLSSMQIPQNITYINHYSWLSNNKSRDKVNYQLKHLGECSYKWNEEKQQLEFDEIFFRRRGMFIPFVGSE